MRRARREAARRAASPAARIGGESPLRRLARRRDKDGRPLLAEPQVQAAERLAQDFWHARLQPRVTANWCAAAPSERTRRSAPGAGVDMRDWTVAARQRFHRALEAVGPELAGLIVDVCCHDIGLEAAERTRGWPVRSAKVVLDMGLTALARHYGLIAPPPAEGRLRHWGDADYRPTLEEWRS